MFAVSRSSRTSVSSFSRASLLAAVVLGGGCMKIYPDAELPDVEAEWPDVDCRGNAGEVTLVLVGVDDTAFRQERNVPCLDLGATFADVPRQRFRIEAALHAQTGEVTASYDEDLDLRDGLDARSYVYFGGYDNLRVGWTFDVGASCTSLGATAVMLEFSTPQLPHPATFVPPCEASPFSTYLPEGVYTIIARAIAGEVTLAISPRTPELTVTADGLTDAGTLVLSPCGAACP